MSKFKDGDRVRKRGTRRKGVLDHVRADGECWFRSDDGTDYGPHLTEEFKRLKPKPKRREAWVNIRWLDLGCAHEARDESNAQVMLKFKPADPQERWVLMREVKKV